jgi:hypothetical protein
LLSAIQAACADGDGDASNDKTVALDLSATKLATSDNGVFDPRNPADGKPYITKRVLPTAATAIDKGAGAGSVYATFAGFTGLAEVSAAGKIDIDNYTFYGCGALTTADFRAVGSIGHAPFSSCRALIELYLPAAPPQLTVFPLPKLFDSTGGSARLTIYVPDADAVTAYGDKWGQITYVYAANGNHKPVVFAVKSN